MTSMYKNYIKPESKMIIYQVLPRLFGNMNADLVKNGDIKTNGCGKFSAFTIKALEKIKELGTTHIWYTGIIEHATQTDYSSYRIKNDHPAVVKGKAGSPYAIKDYYDVDPDLADYVPDRMSEFEQLVKRTHDAGMKVIIDFIPNHVARQYHSDMKRMYQEDLGQHDDTTVGFSPNNNYYYIPGHPLILNFGIQPGELAYTEFPAKVTGNNRFVPNPTHTDWYETVKLNYGVDYLNGETPHFDPRPDTWNKMYDILKFWAQKGVDGFRCDMAELVPVHFWHWVIPEIKKDFQVCFIAEIYNPWEYKSYTRFGNFDYLYDKVGLYDTLRDVISGHIPASSITRAWQSVEGIQSQMLNFLENHDEQRIASGFFAGNPKAGIPGMMVAAWMNTNPVMIYNGQELGEPGMDNEGFSGLDGRTTIFDYWSMTTVRNWMDNGLFSDKKLTPEQKELRSMYTCILQIAITEPAILYGDFHDLMYANVGNTGFDFNLQYAFLRKYRDDVLLVIVNFSDHPKQTRVNIPEEAFDALDFDENKAAHLTDLITGEQNICTLTTAYPYQITVPGYSGKILKFSYKI